eukprot:680784-Prorocentrum_minimum.AAC.1
MDPFRADAADTCQVLKVLLRRAVRIVGRSVFARRAAVLRAAAHLEGGGGGGEAEGAGGR